MTDRTGFAVALEAVLEERRPELLLTTCVGSADVCRVARRIGSPSISWIQDIGEDGHEAFQAGASRRIYASRYLRRFFAPVEDNSSIFYPPFQAFPFLPPAGSRTVLMVNAIPEKGSDVFLSVAKIYPDVRLIALTGWRLPEWVGSAPPNVVCLERAEDPIPAYRSADVVLVPSPVPEGFGRVAVEAALLGRRVLCHASDCSSPRGRPRTSCPISPRRPGPELCRLFWQRTSPTGTCCSGAGDTPRSSYVLWQRSSCEWWPDGPHVDERRR